MLDTNLRDFFDKSNTTEYIRFARNYNSGNLKSDKLYDIAHETIKQAEVGFKIKMFRTILKNYRKAAKLNHVLAQYEFGLFILTTPITWHLFKKEAIKHLEKAALAGVEDAKIAIQNFKEIFLN